VAEKVEEEKPKLTVVLKDSEESRRERKELMEKLFPIKRLTTRSIKK
jgi:hypothetical protein